MRVRIHPNIVTAEHADAALRPLLKLRLRTGHREELPIEFSSLISTQESMSAIIITIVANYGSMRASEGNDVKL